MNYKTYLIPKKGHSIDKDAKAEDLIKTSFAVSLVALQQINTPSPDKFHKPFVVLKNDNAHHLKVMNDLKKVLESTNAWSPHYDKNGTFSDFLRDPKAFKELLNGQRKLTQKQVMEGKYTLEIPKVLKDKAIQAIQKSRQS